MRVVWLAAPPEQAPKLGIAVFAATTAHSVRAMPEASLAPSVKVTAEPAGRVWPDGPATPRLGAVLSTAMARVAAVALPVASTARASTTLGPSGSCVES